MGKLKTDIMPPGDQDLSNHLDGLDGPLCFGSPETQEIAKQNMFPGTQRLLKEWSLDDLNSLLEK